MDKTLLEEMMKEIEIENKIRKEIGLRFLAWAYEIKNRNKRASYVEIENMVRIIADSDKDLIKEIFKNQ